MTSMFHPLTVAEWDRFTSMIERAGMEMAARGWPVVVDELTEIQGELVTGWQAAYVTAGGDPYRPAGSAPRPPQRAAALADARALLAVYDASADPLCDGVNWSAWEARAAAALRELAR
jgi:hypothetical protein